MRWSASVYGVARSSLLVSAATVVVVSAVSAQERPVGAGGAKAELIAFEREIEAAVLRADVSFLDRVCTDDFTYTHGDGWTSGGPPLSVDTKADWLESLPGRYTMRDVETEHVEVHGDVAITTGRVLARQGSTVATRRAFSFWYVRVYERRDGQWRYLSHRTVRGPVSEQ